MGWYIETLVTFDAEGPGEVALATREYQRDLKDRPSIESGIILGALAEGRGYTMGPKGGLWAIAFTGNYTNGERLAQELLPFFKKLWKVSGDGTGLVPRDGLLSYAHNATIITQDEQHGSSRIFTIRYPGVIKEYAGPDIWYSEEYA